jgi:hypothetical protein
MDRRSKHLSSEERGVIYAEHERGRSQRRSGGFWGALPARSGASWRGAVGPMAAIARKRRAAPTIRGARAAGAGASWPKAARFTASCMTTLSFGAGLQSRSRRDCGA